MKNTEQLIKDLIESAIIDYTEEVKPDAFATGAAFKFAKDAAAEFNPESANAAAFVAIWKNAAAIIDLTTPLVKIADDQKRIRDEMKLYRASSPSLIGGDANGLFFRNILSKKTGESIDLETRELYHSKFHAGESDDQALNAACAIYPHVYACVRAAYIHATAVAARYSDQAYSRRAFTTAITARLTADLNHQPIEPTFFIQIMCSETVKIIGIVLLVAGLLALSLATCGFVLAPVGAVIASVGASNALFGVAGTAMTIPGAGLLTGRFFTMHNWQSDNEKSRLAVEAMNVCSA